MGGWEKKAGAQMLTAGVLLDMAFFWEGIFGCGFLGLYLVVIYLKLFVSDS